MLHDVWAAGSLAVVLPLRTAPVTRWREGARGRSCRTPWDLTGLGRGSLVTPPHDVPQRPVADPRLRAAVAPRAGDHHVWIQRPGPLTGTDWTPLPGDWDLHPGCFVTAVEHVVHREPQEAAYVVLHVQLTGVALRDPAAAAAFFAHPTSVADPVAERPAHRERIGHQVLDGLLRELGVVEDDALESWERPFVISHLVPRGSEFRGGLPAFDLPDHLAVGWVGEHAWAARMAQASDLDLDREPGLEPTPAQDAGTWLGSTWAHPAAHGLSFVAARGVSARPSGTEEGALGWTNSAGDRPYREHTAMSVLAHRDAVDLVVLAMRQRRFLADHAERLPRATRPADPRRRMRLAQQHEDRMTAFRTRWWLTRVPDDAEVSAVLRGVQAALGVPRLHDEVGQRQADVARSLAVSAELARLERDERVGPHDRLRAPSRVLAGLAAAVAVGAAALAVGASTGPLGVAAAAASLLVAVLLVVTLVTGGERRSAGGVDELVEALPVRTPGGHRLRAFAEQVAADVTECEDGWVGTGRTSAARRAADVRRAVYDTDPAELRRLLEIFTSHRPGSRCRCAGFPVGLAAVVWNPRAPLAVVTGVLEQHGPVGEPGVDDVLLAGVLEAHGARLDRDTLRTSCPAVPSAERPLTTAAVMRLPRLDAGSQAELWERGRHGGPAGAWADGVPTLAAAIAANARADAGLVATVAGHLWNGDAAARLESVPAPLIGEPDRPPPAPRASLHDVLLERLRRDSGDDEGTCSLEDLISPGSP